MTYEIVRLEEKQVVGICARTSNKASDMAAVIGGLWKRFFQEGIYASIPDKENEKALGIYRDYAGSEKEDYTAAVGCEVKNAEKTEYVSMRIPAGRYAKFVIHGDMVKAVGEAWQEIGKMELPRAFVCDFEEYQDDRMEDAEIHIYIGLKE
ncbi:MAG: AraC family transcriptional regulator [Lachnospiraceae bacterium]|nr:AraC family transcriptional regulator [Lachnospiraceae bacterium]